MHSQSQNPVPGQPSLPGATQQAQNQNGQPTGYPNGGLPVIPAPPPMFCTAFAPPPHQMLQNQQNMPVQQHQMMAGSHPNGGLPAMPAPPPMSGTVFAPAPNQILQNQQQIFTQQSQMIMPAQQNQNQGVGVGQSTSFGGNYAMVAGRLVSDLDALIYKRREKAHIAASKRPDRSLKAKMTSAMEASKFHYLRTGQHFKLNEDIVKSDKSYVEQDRHMKGARARAARHPELARLTSTYPIQQIPLPALQPTAMPSNYKTAPLGGNVMPNQMNVPHTQQDHFYPPLLPTPPMENAPAVPSQAPPLPQNAGYSPVPVHQPAYIDPLPAPSPLPSPVSVGRSSSPTVSIDSQRTTPAPSPDREYSVSPTLQPASIPSPYSGPPPVPAGQSSGSAMHPDSQGTTPAPSPDRGYSVSPTLQPASIPSPYSGPPPVPAGQSSGPTIPIGSQGTSGTPIQLGNSFSDEFPMNTGPPESTNVSVPPGNSYSNELATDTGFRETADTSIRLNDSYPNEFGRDLNFQIMARISGLFDNYMLDKLQMGTGSLAIAGSYVRPSDVHLPHLPLTFLYENIGWS
ncbi:hypothetical protein AJ80_00804 [Polytolypa hystricis UAMH7299]|uniref:Uncharacterized protein n=1 Tax=Polytolypa hystricis (strain UAMH7299) TaxID=1447883 RepID=A0A2B7Z3C8_POLH7|nr:hypothetical protein AJ80_00804 [Polytolypa hystricis UAMH7299]